VAVVDDGHITCSCANLHLFSQILLFCCLPLRSPFRNLCRTWDNKLGRRRFGEYEENYSHDGDSGGIHASGAGFEKMDKIENWRPPAY
jgi:hypothetical protein